MFFDLHGFVKKGLKKGVGIYSDSYIIITAAGWHDKGVLTADDLAELDRDIEAKNKAIEEAKKMAELAEKERDKIKNYID